MKETIIKSNVSIGDRVFLAIRDSLAKGCRRHTIEEAYVTDVSASHGFALGLDEGMWRRCDDVGDSIFFTLDDAIDSIRNAEDYEGFCFYAADGTKWIFTKED